MFKLCFPSDTRDSSIRDEGKALGAKMCHSMIMLKQKKSKYVTVQGQGNDLVYLYGAIIR